jgi:hypothetical protein
VRRTIVEDRFRGLIERMYEQLAPDRAGRSGSRE